MLPEKGPPMSGRALQAMMAAALLLCPAAADEIDDVVAKLSATHGLWVNGLYPTLDLPRTATAEQVLTRMFERISFDRGKVTEFKLVQLRTIQLDQAPMQAALVDTNQGRKVVLFRWEKSGWWSRTY